MLFGRDESEMPACGFGSIMLRWAECWWGTICAGNHLGLGGACFLNIFRNNVSMVKTSAFYEAYNPSSLVLPNFVAVEGEGIEIFFFLKLCYESVSLARCL